jgi:tRNA (guanine10-N2)-dimethyltransferase
MQAHQYIYNINYPFYEKELCAFELRALFGIEIDEKVFFTEIKVKPSISPFIKNRLEIIYEGTTFDEILKQITTDSLTATDFMVKYLQLEKLKKSDKPNKINEVDKIDAVDKPDSDSKKRRELCKKVGLCIDGHPSYKTPSKIFGITVYQGNWYFGILTKSDNIWKMHNDKPYTYSSSIGINTAKVLVNIAGKGDTTKKLVDPCCGVGTVLLEGESAGYQIKGWEINSKIADDARDNLKHFNYHTRVTNGDIKDIEESFDAAIIDLPYGNFSKTNQEEMLVIIRNAKRIAQKVVIVSSEDITEDLVSEALSIIDFCKIGKNRISNFTRYIWVCE